MARLFGTDGVRGLANVELTPELAMAIGVGAVTVLPVARPTVVVGRDTRPSGELLEAAVSAGLASAGADVISLGVVPTPAVAHAVAASGADLGIVLSASHNAMPDNGIKVFGAAASSFPTTSRTRSRPMSRRRRRSARPALTSAGCVPTSPARPAWSRRTCAICSASSRFRSAR